jgi:cell division transport system permease protein
VSFISPYIFRETAGNLVRNIVMTVAAVITMAVSLTALGGTLIMHQAVNKATNEWQGGVQLAVFMDVHASHQEIVAINHELHQMVPADVQKYWFVDKKEAYQEFKQMFSGESDLIKVMSPATLPSSFRIVPTKAQTVTALADQFQDQPGVYNVQYPSLIVHEELAHFASLRNVALVVASGVMLGAIALVVNTIQLAIFARRREVAVMKLVGATNWFIRVPFMLEGLIEGLVGAGLAFLITYFARSTFAGFTNADPVELNQTVVVSPHEAVLTGLFLVVVGVLVGAFGSGFAVRRFLKV